MAKRRNKRVTKQMSRMTAGSWNCLAMLFVVAIAVIINVVADSHCEQTSNLIGEKERQIRSLEDAKVREAARWEELKTSDKLEKRLVDNGMPMKYAHQFQVIRMDANGKLIPDQHSVAIATKRSRSRQTARVR